MSPSEMHYRSSSLTGSQRFSFSPFQDLFTGSKRIGSEISDQERNMNVQMFNIKK